MFQEEHVKASCQKSRAEILQLRIHKDFSPGHTLDLLICKPIPYENCDSLSKLIPLVVAMWERKEEENITDLYYFDYKGVCLSHNYSRVKEDRKIIDERDNSVSRLVEHGKTIKDLIGNYVLPSELMNHVTVMDLKNDSLREKLYVSRF